MGKISSWLAKSRMLRCFFSESGVLPKADRMSEIENEQEADEKKVENEAVCYLRAVIECLLQNRGLSYRDMHMVLIDRELREIPEPGKDEPDTDSDAIFENDNDLTGFEWNREEETIREYVDGQILEALCQITDGLNHLVIYTKRPEYFSDFAKRMLQEYGLIVVLAPKENDRIMPDGLVLDFEYGRQMKTDFLQEDIIYLPIYKKPWQIAENLDISVPIGYNTVIVKGAIKQDVSSYPDRFEREFYEN